MFEKRGILIGILAGLTYGYVAIISWIPPARVVRWSQRHPVLDGLFFAPAMFMVLALLTSLSLMMCLGITVVSTVLLLGLMAWIRRRQSRTLTDV